MDKDSEVFNVPLNRTKEKQVYVDALSETLTKLLPSQSYFKTDINTNMGFLLGKFFNTIVNRIYNELMQYLINLVTKINLKKSYVFLLFSDAEYRINDQHQFVKVEDWNEQSKKVKRYVTYITICQ